MLQLTAHSRNMAGMDHPAQESDGGVLPGVDSRSHLTASLPCPLASGPVQKWGKTSLGAGGGGMESKLASS